MARVTLKNVLHVVHFNGARGRKGKGMLPRSAENFNVIHELLLPTHDCSGLRLLGMDDFGHLVRGLWWIVLQLACESPVRGYLLQYAGDGRIEPLRAEHIARRVRMSPRRWAGEIEPELMIGRAGLLERLETYELDLDAEEVRAYQAPQQGDLFPEPGSEPAGRTGAWDEPRNSSGAAVRPGILERMRHPQGLGKYFESELGRLLAAGRPGSSDVLQWQQMFRRCLMMLTRDAQKPPPPALQAERLERVLQKAEQIHADAAARRSGESPIKNPPAVLAAWGRKNGILRSGSSSKPKESVR